MKKQPAKFQNDSWKNEGIAHKRYIHNRSSNAEKLLDSTKSGKNFPMITSKSHAILLTMKKKPAKFQNDP